MKINKPRTRTNRALRLAALGSCLACLLSGPSSWAKPIPANLGYGLDKLVESKVALEKPAARGTASRQLFNGYATQEAANYAASAISSEDGRFMVDITLTADKSFEEIRDSLQSQFGSFEVVATDAKYHGAGIIEAWLSVDEAADLAKAPGVRAVFLAQKPQLQGSAAKAVPAREGKDLQSATPTLNFAMLGTKFMQGVTQHRVDKINQFYNPSAPVNYDGQGVTVGVLSDSFNKRTTNTANTPNAATNVANFDLPGDPNNPINKTPVLVLDDPTSAATDEGRGMCEIVYKMAPRTRLGFAQAGPGEVGFANNIRALSGRYPDVAHTQPGFQADIITDDVSYGGEPLFGDTGVIAIALNDVVALGVSYFSSAANFYGVSAYNSDLRIIPNGTGLTAADGNTALANTNINLAGVPTNLYQGGFHNFNPNGQDIACLWNVNNGVSLELQWDDPYDYTDPVLVQPPIYSNTGTITDANPVTYSDLPTLNAGTRYIVTVKATSGNFDAIVSIIDPTNTTIVDQDTGTDEVVTFFPPSTGQYKVAVRRFSTTTGSFTIDLNTAVNNGTPLTTDLNVLAFRADTGAYVSASSLTSNNIANNRPVELGTVVRPTGQTQLQFVVARASNPTAPRAATHFQLNTKSNSSAASAPAEYFDYNSSVTGGHAIAAGCNGIAGYNAFRPSVPQDFTSAGPALIYFDRDNNRLAQPEVRLQPRLAGTNGANSTWLSGDSLADIDTGNGQFGGTSASAPHIAAIAALVLQAHGGTASVTPAQMTSLLQRSTFPHDLDPYLATGVARASNGGKVTVSIRSDNTAVQSRGRNDPNSHSISYVGPSSITQFQFNPNGLPAEGGAVTSGQNGVDVNNNYFSNVTPGLYFTNLTALGNFPFTFGSNSVGLAATDVTATLSNPAPSPAAATGQGQTLTLSFASGSFSGGDVMRFTIGRGLDRSNDVTTSGGTAGTNFNSDLFGGGVQLPEGIVIQDGMRFSGTLADGATFDGRIRNRIGNGYSSLDGFGFVNAEQAVVTPIQ